MVHLSSPPSTAARKWRLSTGRARSAALEAVNSRFAWWLALNPQQTQASAGAVRTLRLSATIAIAAISGLFSGMSDADAQSELMDALQRQAFDYFVYEAKPLNGLIADKTKADWPASIAAVGFALSSYPVGVERGFIDQGEAAQRTLATLQFFHNSVQSRDADATGYKGFYYHFLDMNDGKRAWNCELSTIDTALLLAGMLTAAQYFSGDGAEDCEIRELADALYRRVDWNWAQNGGPTVTLGWKSRSGFLRYRWQGYSEGLLISCWAWARRHIRCRSKAIGNGPPPTNRETSTIRNIYTRGRCSPISFLTSGSIFLVKSRTNICVASAATILRTAVAQPTFIGSMRSPIPAVIPAMAKTLGGSRRAMARVRRPIASREKNDASFGYRARGAPYGPDDGSLAPWAVAASLPFAPEIVAPALRYFETLKLRESNPYGFKATFNATIGERSHPPQLWVSPFHFGINQGPIVLMIENFRTGLI